VRHGHRIYVLRRLSQRGTQFHARTPADPSNVITDPFRDSGADAAEVRRAEHVLSHFEASLDKNASLSAAATSHLDGICRVHGDIYRGDGKVGQNPSLRELPQTSIAPSAVCGQ
jgi:hypothetical protein